MRVPKMLCPQLRGKIGELLERFKIDLCASHGGWIAGLKVCMNGCMSVDEISCFSYQVAAGSTTSE